MSIAAPVRALGPQHRLAARWLLTGSLIVWTTTTTLIFQLSRSGGVPMLLAACVGGGAASVLATLRTPPTGTFKPDMWVIFRMVSIIAAGGIWTFVLRDFGSQSDLDPRWISFFLGVLVYTLVRDTLQTLFTAVSANLEARRRERARIAERDRVLALLKQRATKPKLTAKILHLPLEGE